MKKTIQSGLRAGLKNWTTLLFFEILYKVLGYWILGVLVDEIRGAVLKNLGISFIGQQNVGEILRSPLSVLMIWGLLLFSAFLIYMELTALIIYCEAGWQGRYISVLQLAKEALRKAAAVFHIKNMPVILVLIPVMGISVLPLKSSLTGRLRIPEFIFDFIVNVPVLLTAFIVVMILLNILLFFYLFCFPEVILKGKKYYGSLKDSVRLLKGKKIKTLAKLLLCVLVFLFAAFCLSGILILLLWVWSKLQQSPDGGVSFFRFHYLKSSSMVMLLFGILGPLSLCSAVITLYHQYHKDVQPEARRRKRTPKSCLINTITVAAAVILLLLFSETELGGTSPSADDSGIEIVAHRAGAAFAPENTIAALNGAIRDKADCAEIDVQQTRDGKLIIMHDSDFRRTAGLKKKVWETDYAEVESLDAGFYFSSDYAGENIPTLEEMLEAAKGKIHLMIELKATGHEHALVEQTVEQIEEAGMEEECMIASMNLELLQRSKELDSQIRTVYITTLAFSEFYDISYVDGYSVETSFLSQEMIAQVQSENKKVYAWTANSENNILKIIRSGADGLVTDNPKLADFYLRFLDVNYFLDFLTEVLYTNS